MADSNVNTIVLTKEAYDKIKSENMRCRTENFEYNRGLLPRFLQSESLSIKEKKDY